jgi:hypothetical protein
MTGHSMSADETVRAYLDWCIARGIRPTFYEGSRYIRVHYGPHYRPLPDFQAKTVPMADFLGDAPANEWTEGDAE